MISREKVEVLVREYSPVPLEEQKMVSYICEHGISELDEKPTDHQISEKIKLISFSHQTSSSADDDEHWTAFSPFNNKFYVFSNNISGEPTHIGMSLPSFID